MATTLGQIMEGLEARLATISGLRVSDVGPDQVNPPHAIVGVPPIPEYHATMRMGTFRVELPIWLLVSASLDRISQRNLADYANPSGPTSVRAAIEADKTLGGIAQDAMVKDFRPLGLEEVGIIGYFGGLWTVQVLASGV